MNWAKVTSYQTFLAALRVAREGMSKRIPLPSDIYSRPPCTWEERSCQSQSFPWKPQQTSLPAQDRCPELCSESSVRRISASSLHKATESWNHLQMRCNTNMKFSLPPSNELHMFSSKQHWHFTGRTCSCIPSWFRMAVYFLLLTYK